MHSRRTILQYGAATALMPAAPRALRAETYPTHPIRLIVGFPAGGQVDIIARLTAQWLGQQLGQSVVVEDKPGAGGNLGAEAVINSPPDGYTLFFGATSNVVNTSLIANLSYDFARDTVAIAPINRIPLALEANPQFSARNVGELVALAKAKPGSISMGSPSAGTPPYLAVELLKMMAGIDIVHVPYLGENQMVTDLLGGQLMVGIGGISSGIGHIEAGRLRGLGVTTPQRIEQLPNVPAIAETIPNFEASGWTGLVAPKGTPADIVDKIASAVRVIQADATFKERLSALGAPLFTASPAEFTSFITTETEKWAKVVKFAGLKPQ